MANNTILNPGALGDTIATKDLAGVKHELVIIEFNDGAGGVTEVSAANPLPVLAAIDTTGLATSANQSTEIAALASIAAEDFATQTTLAAVLAKITSDPATQTTLVAILAKIIAAPATEAKQDTGNTSLSTIAGKDFATQTTLAALLAKVITAPSTEAKQDAIITLLTSIDGGTAAALGQALMAASVPVVIASNQSAVPISGTVTVDTSTLATSAKQDTGNTSLASILAKIIAAPSTEAKQDAANALLTTIAAITQPLTDAQLRASAVPVSISQDIEIGAVELKNGTDDTRAIVTAANALKVDGSAVTQPVSGTFFQATQPVSAAALPLPSGAATAANQQTNALTDTQLRATPVPVSGTVATGGLTDAQLRATPVPVSATDLDIRNLVFATDKTDVSGSTGVGVTGTFFQATQPVSAAALPLPSGAATSALQTQPGVDIGDVTINNANGAAAVNIQDGGNSITVDGTVAVTGVATAARQDDQTALLTTIDGAVAIIKTSIDTVAGAVSGTEMQVDVITLPALPAGNNNIGDVDVASIAAGDNNIGNVDVASIAAGANIIGKVGIDQTTDGTTNKVSATQATASNFNAQVVGNIAHDSVDSGNPVKVGQKAISFGTNPTAVASGDRTDWYANIAGIPFMIGGHPNIVCFRATYTAVQTDTAIITISTGLKIVVTRITVTANAANTVNVSVIVGFGTANTPTTTGVVLSHPGLAPGSGVVEGNGAGILGVGGDGAELRINLSVPTGGSADVVVSYFTIEG